MNDWIATATHFIAEHGIWAGPIVGALAFGESLAVIGMLVPATALMIAMGGMIGTGLVDPLPVLLWAVAGAVLGDWLSFLLGRRIGPASFRRWPLNKHRHSVARARLFFRRYGVISILLGRFLGPVRATIPLVAGLMGMRQRSFQIANVTSAVLWVPALFAPGFLAARSLGPVAEISEAHLLGMGLIILLMTVGGLLIAGRVLGAGNRRRDRRGRERMLRAAR